MKVMAHCKHQDLHKVFGIAPGSITRFGGVDEGRRFLVRLSDKFVVSKNPSHQRDDAVVFWVKGFGIGEREREAGLLGNFVRISLDFDESGCFAKAETFDEELRLHPQRLKPRQATPNWGFWVLRRVKKRWRYNTFAEAMADIGELRESFPNATTAVPNQDGFTVLVFSSVKDGSREKPVKKYMLQIKQIANYYVIDYHENLATFRSKGVRVNESYDGSFVFNEAILKNPAAIAALFRTMRENIEWGSEKFGKGPPRNTRDEADTAPQIESKGA